MLVGLSMVEQRYEAVMAVLRDGEPVTEVAARLGVDRSWSSPGFPDTYRLRLRPLEGVRDAWTAPAGVPASCC